MPDSDWSTRLAVRFSPTPNHMEVSQGGPTTTKRTRARTHRRRAVAAVGGGEVIIRDAGTARDNARRTPARAASPAAMRYVLPDRGPGSPRGRASARSPRGNLKDVSTSWRSAIANSDERRSSGGHRTRAPSIPQSLRPRRCSSRSSDRRTPPTLSPGTSYNLDYTESTTPDTTSPGTSTPSRRTLAW